MPSHECVRPGQLPPEDTSTTQTTAGSPSSPEEKPVEADAYGEFRNDDGYYVHQEGDHVGI